MRVFATALAFFAACLALAGQSSATALALQPRAGICILKPLGHGKDDTDQIDKAIKQCGTLGIITLGPGNYNITRKMTWNLVLSEVHIYGYLSFNPDPVYWLDADNTYRVVFIQNQASWFVVTGHDFVIDGHGQGGIQGNGQTWWSYYATRTKADGDGRPIAFTLSHVQRATVRNFRIEAQPFWCNTVADSSDVTYDGMYCNATNTDPLYVGKNIVPNTDGINTYRSNNINLLNWDITCGDDCLAIKGNSTNIVANGIKCRGGNGIAVGSLGQYVNLPDIVENLTLENVQLIRLDPSVQPNMANAIYFKTWTGTVNGVPPSGGGGGTGYVKNVITKNIQLDRVDKPLHLYQTNGGHSQDLGSQIEFSQLTFDNWSGTSTANKIVDIECSAAAPCPNIKFQNFKVTPPAGQLIRYICQNVVSESGLSAPCNATGNP